MLRLMQHKKMYSVEISLIKIVRCLVVKYAFTHPFNYSSWCEFRRYRFCIMIAKSSELLFARELNKEEMAGDIIVQITFNKRSGELSVK